MNKYRLSKYEYYNGNVMWRILNVSPGYKFVLVEREKESEIMDIWNRMKRLGGLQKETIYEQIQF